MDLLILGGAGRQAESIVLDLLQLDPDNVSKITLADRDGEALKTRVDQLGSPKVKWEVIDIADHSSLVGLMKKHDLVFNAANTPTVPLAVRAALEAGVNLASLEGLHQHAVVPDAPSDEFGFVNESYRAALDEAYREAGIVGVLGWGYVPGTTNFLGRMLGDEFDRIDSMTWYYAAAQTGDKLFFSETPRETIWLHKQPGVILKDGKYQHVPPMSGREWIAFPEPIGEVEVQRMPLMSTVPVFADRYRAKGIQNVDVKLGYWPGYLEKMDFLDSVGLLDLEPRDIGGVQVAPADVFLAGPGVADKAGAALEDHGCVRLVVDGTIANRKVVYEGEVIARPMRNLGAMQLLTGIPAAVGIQMIATGEITRTGLCTTADDVVEPGRYFEELGRRGYEVTTTCTETIVE